MSDIDIIEYEKYTIKKLTIKEIPILYSYINKGFLSTKYFNKKSKLLTKLYIFITNTFGFNSDMFVYDKHHTVHGIVSYYTYKNYLLIDTCSTLYNCKLYSEAVYNLSRYLHNSTKKDIYIKVNNQRLSKQFKDLGLKCYYKSVFKFVI